jgi:hypothetical protein
MKKDEVIESVDSENTSRVKSTSHTEVSYPVVTKTGKRIALSQSRNPVFEVGFGTEKTEKQGDRPRTSDDSFWDQLLIESSADQFGVFFNAGLSPFFEFATGQRLVEKVVYGRLPDILRLFLKFGLTFGGPGCLGERLVDIAIYRRDVETLRLLVDAGAPLNGRTPSGISLVEKAVLFGESEIVDLFLDEKVDISGPFSFNRTLVNVSEESGNFDVSPRLKLMEVV